MYEVRWEDLVGRSHAEMDCLELVREFFKRGGITLGQREDLIASAIAGTPAQFIEVSDAPSVGDIVCMWDDVPGAVEHLGVIVEGRKVLHSSAATQGVKVVRLEALQQLGRVVRRLRYVAC